jgi:hypothetical protein
MTSVVSVQREIEFLNDGGPVDAAITLSGAFSSTDFREMTDALTSDPRWRAGLALLVDISAFEVAQLSDDAFGEVTAPVVARDWDFPPRAVAIIAPDDERFRAAQSYRAHLGGSKSRRHVVRTRADALAWLDQQRPS